MGLGEQLSYIPNLRLCFVRRESFSRSVEPKGLPALPSRFFFVCLLFTSFFRVLLSAHLSRGGHRRCDDYAGSFRGAPIMDARKEQQELQSPEWGSMRRPCSSWLRSTLRAPSRRAVPGVVDVCGPRLWFLRREWHAFQGRLRILPFTVCVRSLKNKQKG